MLDHQLVHQARMQANEAVLMCLIDRLDPRLIQGLLEAVQREYRRTKLDSTMEPEELLQWSPVLQRIQEAASRVGKAPP
jgi:hypothetical protein